MTDQNCIFCKIISGQIPAAIVAQNDTIIVIKDIAPKAPIHYLIIPKQHVSDIKSLEPATAHLASDMLLMAKELSNNLAGTKSFRLIMNNGRESGQSVFHLHCHFLSGKQMLDF